MCANSCSIRVWLWSGANAEPTKIHIYLISNIKISPVALQDFDNRQVSPSAGPVYGPRAQLKHSRSHHPPPHPPPQSHPISSAGIGSLEPGALVWEDNLTQSHHHLYKPTACTHVLLDLLSWYQLLFLKAFGQLEHVLPGRRGGVLSSSAGKCKYIISWNFSMLYFIHILLWCRESPTSSWAFGFPPSSRYLSMISSLHSLAAFMNSAVSTGSICPHRHTEEQERQRFTLYISDMKTQLLKIILTTCISTDSLGMNVFLVFFFRLPSSELSCSALRSKLSLHRSDEILPVLSSAWKMTGTITNTVWKPRSARECWLWKQRCQASYGVLRAGNDSVNVKTNSQHSANQAWP